MTGSPVRVLIVDDHPLMLAGVRRALERAESIEIAGEARSAPEAMSLIERRRPDIVLMDLRMPGVSGTEHIEKVRANWPGIKVVVLSASEDRSAIDAALHAGAHAFVVKSVSSSDIGAVLRQVATGAVVHAPSPAPVPAGGAPSEDLRDRSGLTARERGILVRVAKGLTTGEISRDLFISEHTVKFHLTNVYRKIGVSNRTAAVRYAVEKGLAADE